MTPKLKMQKKTGLVYCAKDRLKNFHLNRLEKAGMSWHYVRTVKTTIIFIILSAEIIPKSHLKQIVVCLGVGGGQI